MIKVYAPYPTDYFADWFTDEENFCRSTNQNEVLAQQVKIACLPAYFSYKITPDFIRYNEFDLLLFSDIEFDNIDTAERWIASLNLSSTNHHLLAVGGLYDYSVIGDTIYRPWWCFNFVHKNVYKNVDIDPKPYIFDALLGSKKPHRDMLMSLLQTHGLLNNSIVTYRDVFPAPGQTVDEHLRAAVEVTLQDQPLLYPYISPNLDPAWEVCDNVSNSVSDISPWSIYQQTRYSIVAETVYKSSFFFSEKTTKAMFSKRLFVVFSSPGYLTRLRSMGFQTFNNVIDESYDLEQNDVRRFNMAFQQLKQLTQLDYTQVQAATSVARQHNFDRLYTLEKEIKEEMQEMVYIKLKEIKC